MDSCIVKNGVFEIKGKVKYPVNATCYNYSSGTTSVDGVFLFWLENSEISVDTKKEDMRNTPRVSGSREADIYYEYNDRVKDYDMFKERPKLLEEQLKIMDEYNDSYVSLKFAKTISSYTKDVALIERF